MSVGGIREVQMPFALQLAVEAVLRAHSKRSTDRTLGRKGAHVNLFRSRSLEEILKPLAWRGAVGLLQGGGEAVGQTTRSLG